MRQGKVPSFQIQLLSRTIRNLLTVYAARFNSTLRDLLETSRKEIELNAQANIDMATKIRNNLEVPLENFMLELKDKRKLVSTT